MIMCVACLCCTSFALAQIDPDPDGIGVYFDTAATVNYIDAPPGFPVEFYIIITNPTEPAMIGWECSLEIQPQGGYVSYVLTNPPGGGAINVETPPNFVVGYSVPFPMSPATVVATGTIIVTSARTNYTFRLHPAPNPSAGPWDGCYLPLYVTTTYGFVPLHYSCGWEQPAPDCVPNIVAAINGGEEPTAAENTTWSQIKALYE